MNLEHSVVLQSLLTVRNQSDPVVLSVVVELT